MVTYPSIIATGVDTVALETHLQKYEFERSAVELFDKTLSKLNSSSGFTHDSALTNELERVSAALKSVYHFNQVLAPAFRLVDTHSAWR